jgi:subtilisin family serine protease
MLVGRVLADVGHSCRALVLGLLAVGVLAMPLTARGSGDEHALVPAELLAAAQANPDQVFAVIVQGRPKSHSSDVAADVAAERAASPGKGKGIRKRFATISGVAAELTGKQVAKLAQRNGILTITRDALVAASGGMLPPSPLASPVIDGLAQERQQLTAVSDGVWNGTDPIEYVRRWQRCDALGSVCVDIAGSGGAVYSAAPADVGSTLRLTVTATNAVGSETGISEPTAVVVAAPAGPLPPVNMAAPTIGGTATEGQTLTASEGTWTGSFPVAYAFAWQRCDATGAGCVATAGASGASYVLTSSDVGSTLRVVVTATDSGGSTAATSFPSGVVQPAPSPPPAPPAGPLPPANLTPPSITGTATEGQTLSASEGTWGATFPVAYAYAWERCDSTGTGCGAVPGATGATYVAAQADVGSTLRVVVTATDAGGSASAASVPTAVVSAVQRPPVLTTPPAVSGDARDGATLTATAGAWSGTGPITNTYAWERCGTGYSQAVLADHPTAYWRLDDGSALDSSGNGYTGVGAGTLTAVDGATSDSSALGFGAGAGIDVANANIGAAFTLETWVRVDGPQQDKGLLGRWRYDDGGGALLWIDTGGHYGLAVGRAPATYLTTTVAPHPHRWEHVVGTWDGSALRIFVNGQEVASKPFVGDPGSTLRAFEIGKYGDPTQHLAGALDEAALYATALDAAVVARHYTAGCVEIAGATGATYSIGASDVGSQLRARVDATSAAGSATAVSNVTVPVAAAPPASVAAPQVNGSAVVTQTLTASTGTWSGTAPIQLSHRWQRCDAGGACTDITGATSATYTLTSADVGSTVKTVVSATNAAGSAEAASAATETVGSGIPVNTTPPSLSGTPEDGSTLIAATGVWGDGVTTPTVQWERCDAAGARCDPIAGATGASYVLSEADVGATVRAVVTVTNSVGSTTAATAPSTVVADSFTALQQWPTVFGAQPSWTSAKSALAVPAIAIVDSGIDASRSDFGGRVIHEETLTSLTPNSPGDGRGHGTFVASVAAGEAADYSGVAPNSKIVSIDVLDDSGRATISDVISAADWIYRNKDTYNIRVANFSLHSTTAGSFRFDPLNKAVQKLWFNGVVVVASAGNYAVAGAASNVPFPPGNDPFAITVGATDTLGTVDTADDKVAPWSAWGHTSDGFVKPELSAPGRYIVGAVPLDSTLAREQPERMIAPGYMQLSGTSFATPMVSGAAAYLAGLHPEWTPDQIKGALMRAASNLPTVAPTSGGIGELNVGAAAALTAPPNPNVALNQFKVQDAAGDVSFDEARWAAAVAANPTWADGVWGDGVWGDGVWGDGVWGDGVWGDAYWDPPVAPPDPGAPGGTATSALNGAASDWLPAGGYWLTPR